ncbi:hypothetical protein OGAPHI_005985 [Ogataea philodendri]|uniref:Uncharacterized protein n=1 Tax=Ogataea philodendri TaxID=1378263 RepID=A0A9P8NYI0_9ASCO|nr:uncharacterized protein OGAPHI_005985 [Ogataea philodendri]KAH3661807.1 hypothetical protein OGAPHI_005985 [Ogataea philodendri]
MSNGLPSQDEFRLHNVLRALPEAQRDLVSAVSRVGRQYVKDLDDQCIGVLDIERDEVLERLDRVRHTYEVIKSSDVTARIQKVHQIEEDLGEIAAGLVDSQERIDRLIDKIKKIEKTSRQKDRLFDPKTFHVGHYRELYKYGMHNEHKEINPLKEQQILNLEQEIIELQRERSSSISGIHNPTHLLVHESPVTEISETTATAPSQKFNEDVSKTLRGYFK